MDIEKLSDKINNISDSHYVSIIELIINAVREYPLYGLNDTDEYFREIINKLNSNEITIEALVGYIERNPEKGKEDNIWVISSMNSLVEALELITLYKISFEEIMSLIKTLSE